MRLRHKPWAETQLDVIDAFAPRVFDVFVGHAPYGIGIDQHRGHPMKELQEGDEPRLRHRDLNVWSQTVEVARRQRQVVLEPQIQDGAQTDRAVEMAMEVEEGKR